MSRCTTGGDDPAFLCATELLGNVNEASWGVCRRDVREDLQPNDFVVFFCAKPRLQSPTFVDYYYVGVGTVAEALPRHAIWTDHQYAAYRKFYNVLAQWNGEYLIQKEVFHPYHENWRQRATAPYIIFNRDAALTSFNLTNPTLVATYDGLQIPERWNEAGEGLRDYLFTERGIERGLRSSKTGYGHAKINLLRQGNAIRPGRPLEELRQALIYLLPQKP